MDWRRHLRPFGSILIGFYCTVLGRKVIRLVLFRHYIIWLLKCFRVKNW